MEGSGFMVSSGGFMVFSRWFGAYDFQSKVLWQSHRAPSPPSTGSFRGRFDTVGGRRNKIAGEKEKELKNHARETRLLIFRWDKTIAA